VRRLILLLTAVLLLLGGCTSYNTDRNQLTARYGGGITEEKVWKGMVASGTTRNWEFGTGAGDDLYSYPATPRTWLAESQRNNEGRLERTANADRPGVECVTIDGTRMLVDYALSFRLNREPEVFRAFHENIGDKNDIQAWRGGENWNRMVGVYFDSPVEKLIVDLCGGYTADELRNDSAKRREFGQALTAQGKEAIDRRVGGDYFCGSSLESCGEIVFDVGRPELVNRDIILSEEQRQIASNEVAVQTEENRRIEEELKAVELQIAELGPENYVLLKAIESGKITFMQLPPGGNVAVGAPPQAEE
jgi:hypothetical protein